MELHCSELKAWLQSRRDNKAYVFGTALFLLFISSRSFNPCRDVDGGMDLGDGLDSGGEDLKLLFPGEQSRWPKLGCRKDRITFLQYRFLSAYGECLVAIYFSFKFVVNATARPFQAFFPLKKPY
jgi:hypothetical protein